MKNKISILLIALMTLGITSCGPKTAKIETLADLQGKVIGTLSSGISEEGKVRREAWCALCGLSFFPACGERSSVHRGW